MAQFHEGDRVDEAGVAGGDGYALRVDHGQASLALLVTLVQGSNAERSVYSSFTLTPNVWTHIAMTIAGGTLRMWSVSADRRGRHRGDRV